MFQIDCNKIEEDESGIISPLSSLASQQQLLQQQQHEMGNLDHLIRRYLKLKAILQRVVDANEDQQFVPIDNDDTTNNNEDRTTILDRFYKRGSSSSGEGGERYAKGKRVNNKNMFSSGLQGVWGVPGRK